jgi:hypothetical protein
MGKVTIHKFYRRLKDKAQFRLCDDKRCDNAENVVYRYKKVTCKKCKAKKGTRL